METAVWDLKSQFEAYKDKSVFDCYLAEYLLSEGRYHLEQEKTFEKYGVKSLEELAEKQKTAFAEKVKLKDLFENVEQPLIPVLWQMERRGVKLDVKRLRKVGLDLDDGIAKADETLRKDFGSEINLNSSVQIGNFLAEKLSVPLSKTKTGRYATNEQELEKHRTEFPIIEHLLQYRELTKLRSTYVDSLITKVDEQSRVHTTYSQVGISTGRLSSANPNLQNIPVTSAYGQKIKSCFVASEGHMLVSFDYSQQELRILAHLTGEEKLIDAFKNNRDVHKITASQIFHVDYDAVTKEQRAVGKTINFGIIYGMSSFGMSAGLNISVEEAGKFIDNFYTTFPKIKQFYDKYFAEGKKNDYVETLFGRRRFVFAYPGQKFIDNATRRVLLNYPIQGTAADLMKMAMIRVQKEIVEKYDFVHLLLQVHDDLVFEIDDSDMKRVNDVAKEIQAIMCGIYELSVPIEIDVKTGKNWGDLEALTVA